MASKTTCQIDKDIMKRVKQLAVQLDLSYSTCLDSLVSLALNNKCKKCSTAGQKYLDGLEKDFKVLKG